MAIGACDQCWVGTARAPTDDDVRRPDWQPIAVLDEPARLTARDAIEHAFSGLVRGTLMTIHDAELADGYGMRTARTARIRHANYQTLSEIDTRMLAEYAVLPFFDAPSFHFHLPAYMMWSLDHYRTSGSISVNSTIYALAPCGPTGALYASYMARFAHFDNDQCGSVAGFLRYLVEFSDGYTDTIVARQALRRYWGAFELS